MFYTDNIGVIRIIRISIIIITIIITVVDEIINILLKTFLSAKWTSVTILKPFLNTIKVQLISTTL